MTSDWGWRIPSFLQVVPSLLQVSFIWFLPESPRWLVSKGRGDEAYAILVKYHAEGDESSDFVKAEYTQIEETLEAELKTAQMNRGYFQRQECESGSSSHLSPGCLSNGVGLD